MRILIKREDFSTSRYELHVGSAALELIGEDDTFSLHYSEIRDFCITRDGRGKMYFTMLFGRTIYEGQILDPQEVIELFMESLKVKLDGVIHIEVRKN